MAEGVAQATGRVQPSVDIRSMRRLSSAQLCFGAAAGLALVALALRLYQIGNESLWLDEAYTLLFSGLPLDRLFTVGGAHEHPPFYYLIVHFLLNLWNSPVAPRLVSAVAGSLSVLVMYALGAKLFGRLAGLMAAGLLAVAPFHVWYGQEARAYELAGLFVLLSYLCLFEALDRPRRAVWVAYAASMALALYSEYTTVFVLVPQLLLMLRARRAEQMRSLLFAWLGAAAAFAPWFVTVVFDASSIAGNYWIPSPSWDSVAGTALEFLGLRTPCPSPPCSGSEATFPIVYGNEGAVAAAVILAAAILLVLAIVRRRLTLGVLTVWLILPFVLVLLIAMKRSLYLDRVFLDATFPLYLLLGAAIARLTRHRVGAGVAVTTIAILMIPAIGNTRLVYANPTKPDWRSAARDFSLAYRPGQAVVFNPGTLRTLLAAYLPGGWHATQERPIWYHSYLDVPGWQQRYATLVRTDTSDERVDLQKRLIKLDNDLRNRELADIAPERQAWLITEDYAGFNDTRRWFVTHGFHLLLSEIYFNDSRIELWDHGLPRDIGPAAMVDDGFGPSWRRSGNVRTTGGIARERGRSSMERSFPVREGATYVANVEYRGYPPAYPLVAVRTYDRNGRAVGSMTDRFGRLLDSFPRTEWYDLPVNGVWLSEPFGFVAPPGAVRATFTLQTLRGECDWRHIEVYRER